MNEEFFEQEQNQVEQTQNENVVANEEAKEAVRSKEYNLRIMRERMESIEKENQEYKRILQQQQQPVEEDEDLNIDDDSFIEAKQYKKHIKNIQKDLKETKKLLEENSKKNAMANAQVLLKSQFNDFDTVVSEENLKKLSDTQPVLYRTLLASSDIYDRGYSAYAMIKNSNIIKNNSQYSDQDKRLEENKAKPRAIGNASPQSGDTPLSKVGDYDRRILTEERKDQLRKQVEEAKRNR
ncbi:hypothetical protein UFOVP1478_11 [uncultured Caudovirales phage]|uniref:Uncharacterized protein n=1 Tax=uncultured Caudovirales phage TaxID=2100421 RepID=A0A6J5S6G4_9CAUD|nr:hypothetical protein UFOVP1112_10 [uncultured Caudovirales phage]CAB4204086.1 hypothetical protein UFOVP1385_31 [uncultured Caudovirales phage]CAB4215274.1 hypothetical protein UFOVP1478_11 [uncultured Caudovirales phage]